MRNLKPTHTALAVAAVSLAVGASAAWGAVTVYDNDFSSRAEYREIIKSGGGKRCERKFRRKSESMLASVKSSPTTCSFRPPVQGDGELPNHDVTLRGKILKKTPKGLRSGAFLELAVRAGGGGIGYILRVFPQRGRFELIRGPSGNDFPVDGKSNAINGVNERNQLQMVASGSQVSAVVNGEQVAEVEDGNPGQVSGSKIRFAVGSEQQKRGSVVATFKRAAVAIP